MRSNVNIIPRDGRGNKVKNPVMSKLKPKKYFENWHVEDENRVYEGEIPSIVGLIMLLVTYKSYETIVYARRDNADRIKDKYSGFKRFIGIASVDPYPVRPRKVSYNAWEAIDDNPDLLGDLLTEEDIIVAQALRKNPVVKVPKESEQEYNPYEEKPDKDMNTDLPSKPSYIKLTPENFNDRVQVLIDEGLTDADKEVFSFWRRGVAPKEVQEALSITASAYKCAKQRIYRQLGDVYKAKSESDFFEIIDDLGLSFVESKVKNEIASIKKGNPVPINSLVFSKLSDREIEVLKFFRKGMYGYNISALLGIQKEGLSTIRRRIVEKIGVSLFNMFVKGKLTFEPGSILEDDESDAPPENDDVAAADLQPEVEFVDDIEEVTEEEPEQVHSIARNQGDEDLLKDYLAGELDKLPPHLSHLEAENTDYLSEIVNQVTEKPPAETVSLEITPKPKLMNEAILDPPTKTKLSESANISFAKFSAAYNLNKDTPKAEKEFALLSEEDKQKAFGFIPKYNASLSNPAFKKTPAAYLASRVWFK